MSRRIVNRREHLPVDISEEFHCEVIVFRPDPSPWGTADAGIFNDPRDLPRYRITGMDREKESHEYQFSMPSSLRLSISRQMQAVLSLTIPRSPTIFLFLHSVMPA